MFSLLGNACHVEDQDASRRDAGSVLIISLFILVLLTIMGLQGMSASHLEEKMASNTREANLAFQTAESALVDGETWLTGQSAKPTAVSACASPPCRVWAVGNLNINANLSDASWWNTQTITSGSGDSPPHYVIEELPITSSTGTSEGQSLAIGQGKSLSAGNTVHYYRVTARGGGGVGVATVVLQSHFVQVY